MASVMLDRSHAGREESNGQRARVRVTHVVFDFNGGGMESLVADMANRFQDSAVEVSLITLSGRVGMLGAKTRDRFKNFEVIKPVPLVSMAVPLGVARTIARTRPDVVHLHTGAWYKGALASRIAGVRRVVYTEHGREHHDPRLHRWIDRGAAQFTDAVVAVSSRLSKYLAKDVGIPASKICTIHNGIDTSVFCPGLPSSGLREALGISPESLVVGSVGRLEAVKAYDVLLEAAAILHSARAHPVVVVLFGDGSQRSALQAHAERLGISEIVKFSGWTSNPVDAYRLLDVFVLPSKSEGQSVSLMEAMACGVTPVVTNVGANAEMLGPELVMNVVEPNQPEKLAQATLAAALSGRRTSSVTTSVRSRATGLYSVERMMSEYEQLYRG